jgi:DNA topoisomerase-1
MQRLLAEASLCGADDYTATPDARESAKAAGLRYVTDSTPGITRRRAGRRFRYIAPDGQSIRDTDEIERIKHIGIPPAWTDVWICPNPRGHLQATGRDAKGRKQYRYHVRWSETRAEVKYERMIAFGEALPTIRERVAHDLARQGLPCEKALATVVALLDDTLARIGNEEYARENDSFGLTTLRQQHVDVEGARVSFEFRGKSGKQHHIEVRNRKLASIVRRYLDLPGYELFQYLDEQGQRHIIQSDDVNDYLRSISSHDFTAKDFRTWGGTTLALRSLGEMGGFDSQTEANHHVNEAIKAAAKRLGNTPAICRKSYVNPRIIEAYLEGALLGAIARLAATPLPPDLDKLRPEEVETLLFLKGLDQDVPAAS